ncbi:cupin domain-containing protein [Salinicola tamaricis]|uniref:cupin domain-containing protein n=1 Tax=Salinicola tamaricis TaxID=1771309 RepID=UPI000D0A67B7|nr:cupin domain-containing protein [Salinicola tamaricis]
MLSEKSTSEGQARQKSARTRSLRVVNEHFEPIFNASWASAVLLRQYRVLELFSPRDIDTQTPHARDELYLIASGSAVLNRDGERLAASVGDVLFVPKGMAHRFDTFSADFSTWVLFFGPE